MTICIDFRNGQGRCSAMGGVVPNSLSYSCLYCKEPIHSICGRQLNDVEQKSLADSLHDRAFRYRACFACDASDEIRLGPAPPPMRKLQSGQHVYFCSPQDGIQETAYIREAHASNSDAENQCNAYDYVGATDGMGPVFEFDGAMTHDSSDENAIQNLEHEWSHISFTSDNLFNANEVEQIACTVARRECQNVEKGVSDMHEVSGGEAQNNL